jgi:hypothetical protein
VRAISSYALGRVGSREEQRAHTERPTDLAQHILVKHNVSANGRVRKTDNNRIALATGATIVNRIEDIRESDVGTNCGLFGISKIGDECVSSSLFCLFHQFCAVSSIRSIGALLLFRLALMLYGPRHGELLRGSSPTLASSITFSLFIPFRPTSLFDIMLMVYPHQQRLHVPRRLCHPQSPPDPPPEPV